MFADDERPVLSIPASTGLTLEFERTFPYGQADPVAGILVRVTGGRVRIEQQVIDFATSGFPAFLWSLYDNFRGWSGERAWRSLEHELRVNARHDGHVHLRWEVSHRPWDPSWTFSITTHHGAGEDVRRLADAFEMLLDPRP